MTTIGFIPARAGSTRVPGKNLAGLRGRQVGGMCLVRRAIECAQAAELDRIVVSSDDTETLRLAVEWGAEAHERPAKHADAHAQIEDAITHWMRYVAAPMLEPDDVLVLLQVTSPFRRPETVRACVDLVRTHDLDSALTVSLDPKRTVFAGRLRGLWDDLSQREIGKRVVWDRPPIRPRTQDVESIPIENGCCYAFTARHFVAHRNRMGGREAVVPIGAIEAWDIDTEDDLRIAQAIASMDAPICATCDRGRVYGTWCSRCGPFEREREATEGAT